VRDDQPGLDHDEIDLGWIGAVTDRGRHHHSNEDAMAVAATAGTVTAVVCDGVSSTPGSARASRNAADAALGVLSDAASATRDWSDAMVDAIESARVAASSAPASDPSNPPACTIVAAIGAPGKIVVGWLGDSRAYWLDATGGRCLTRDDSWGAECVAAGAMTEDVAQADQHAHVITRWLGADAPFFAPHVIDFEPPAAGSLVLCSDGLWNYGPTPEVLAREATGSAGEAARRLCAFALAGGGHDNVTVVVARLAQEDRHDVSP
jgi:serine/threonine protein phosphatase PrpC